MSLARGFAATDEANALLARAARHFAHKIPVIADGSKTLLCTRFGDAELEALAEGLAIDLRSGDQEQLEQLRRLILSHLERFARRPLGIEWHERPT